MAKIYYDHDVNPDLMHEKRVAIVGYGSQGHAHALNLRDSGVAVRIGLRPGGRSWDRAVADGFEVQSAADAAAWANVIMILAPDTSQPTIYKEDVEPFLDEGDTLMFAHGFNIRYETIVPPTTVDVTMVAPKAPGHRVREVFLEGGGTPCLVAVHQDASGHALADALAYAYAIGGTRAGTLETTFTEETETDLFGEQTVLCGGVSHLIKAGFEILVEAGYQPEIAYFECLHELKLIVDLLYQGGLNYMRYSVSDTAEAGDYFSGARVINDDVKNEMREILKEIQDGRFARRWIKENQEGRPNFNAMRTRDEDHLIEQVGAELRGMMPFMDPKTVKPSG